MDWEFDFVEFGVWYIHDKLVLTKDYLIHVVEHFGANLILEWLITGESKISKLIVYSFMDYLVCRQAHDISSEIANNAIVFNASPVIIRHCVVNKHSWWNMDIIIRQ